MEGALITGEVCENLLFDTNGKGNFFLTFDLTTRQHESAKINIPDLDYQSRRLPSL